MKGKNYRFISVLIALALGLNGGLPVLAEALSTEIEDIEDQVSEYVDDENNHEGNETSEAVMTLIALVDGLPSVEEITDENKEDMRASFEEVINAYEGLNDEDTVVFETTKQYTKLMGMKDLRFDIVQMTNESTWDISTGDLILTNTCGNSCNHEVTGTTTTNKIIVQSGTHNVTLNDVSIQFDDGFNESFSGTCAFEIQSGATVNLTLIGDNLLKSGRLKAGIYVPEGATLLITDDSEGELTTTSGGEGAGIGGVDIEATGRITIEGGTINASASNTGVGIGGNGATITIKDGVVNAEGFYDVAIGGSSATVTIEGGTIKASGEMGIGGDDSTITIKNGIVYANGIGGAGIGSNFWGSGSSIIIKGGITHAYSSGGAGIGGGQEGGVGIITISDNAIVYADSLYANPIGAGQGGDEWTVNRIGGIIFEGTSGAVYGTIVTPFDSFTIPSKHGLTIDKDKTVIVKENIKITNEGSLTVNGTLKNLGTLSSTGTIDGTGSYLGNGNLSVVFVENMIKAPANIYYSGTTKSVTVECLDYKFTEGTDYTVKYDPNTDLINPGVPITPTITPTNNGRLIGSETEGDSFQIEKAPLSIHVELNPSIITVGENLPTVSIQYEGMVNGESLDPNIEPKFSGMPENSSLVGEYQIKWENADDMKTEIELLDVIKNYSVSYTDSVTLKINPRPSSGVPKDHITLKPKVDSKGNATLTIKEKDIETAIRYAKNCSNKNSLVAMIKIDSNKRINSFVVTLPKTVIDQLIKENISTLSLVSDEITVSLDANTLKTIQSTTNSDVKLMVTKVLDTKNANDNRPLYDIKIKDDNQLITSFPKGIITLAIAYEPQRVDGNGKVSKNGRYEQTSQLIGVYLDEQGKRHELLNSYYDNTSKNLIIHTNHLSTYGVAYKNTSSSFTDIANHWAMDDINFVVARGLLTGTNNQFLPDELISRGEFVAALAKLADADLSMYQTASFTDCPIDNPYFGAVEWARQYKLIDGAGNGLFAPSSPISRQTMALVLSNYARVMGDTLPSVQKEITFLDDALISSWAKFSVKDLQMAGIVMSKINGNFDPLTSATRAEAAMMLSRYIQANTSDGWKQNDGGEWMYLKNGKFLTGTKSIDGLTYEFDQYGVTQSLPKDQRYFVYIVQNGDTLKTLAKKYEISANDLATVNQLKTSDVLLVGDEIRIPKKQTTN